LAVDWCLTVAGPDFATASRPALTTRATASNATARTRPVVARRPIALPGIPFDQERALLHA
jgi:hypothetical protein